MRLLIAWLHSLSIGQQAAIGMATGIFIATLLFALLISLISQQAIDASRAQRLQQAELLAASLDTLVAQSPGLPEDPHKLLSSLTDSTQVSASLVGVAGNTGVDIERDSRATAHLELVKDLVEQHMAGTRVHRVRSGAHVVAYVPLRSIVGGLLIEQPTESMLSFPLRLLRILPLFGLAVLLVAFVSVWVHSRYIVRPLMQLEEATARIAQGALDEPITITRGDEIGQLAVSFEEMRNRLGAASEARAWWERELEQRVRDRTQEVQNLARRVIHAQEEERQRLAQELRDDTAQALATLLMGIEMLQHSLSPGESRVRQHMQRTVDEGAHALEGLRRVILGLRPAGVDEVGGVAALHAYAVARLAPIGVHVDFEVRGTARKLTGTVESALFRILQEAVNNVAKHAGAENVRVVFDFQDGVLVATVEDDGQGFDPAQASVTGRTIGLQGMRERADIIGARVEVTSSPGNGTRVVLKLPMS